MSGKPRKYTPKLINEIYNLIRSDTYSIAELCKAVGINQDTYYVWKNEKPEFKALVEKAENERMNFFVVEAKRSLIKKIQGYTVQEKKIITVDSGKKDDGGKSIPKIKEQTVTDKHFQPDTTAIIFTLTNGDPANWKNKYSGELTGKDGAPLVNSLQPIIVMSPEEYADLEAKERENKG